MSWTFDNAFRREFGAVLPPQWPNEMLVKILTSTKYSPLINQISQEWKVLEVGVFSGNNARLFLERGMRVSGSEINSEMLKLCTENLTRMGYSVPELRQGSNCNLDFQNEEFNLLVSINTIHYSHGKCTKTALSEFARVVKKGGWVIIETPARNHEVVVNSVRERELVWNWGAGGFRQSELFGFFDSKDHFRSLLLNEFSKIEICYRLEEYKETTLAFWVAICQK